MKASSRLAAGLLVLLCSPAALSGDSRFVFTAAKYRELPEVIRDYYVTGVINGLSTSEVFGEWTVTPAFDRCVNGMSGEQFGAIVDKYVENHPQLWQYEMPVLIVMSFREICPDFDAAFRRKQTIRPTQ